MTQHRRAYTISGRVQGVGYRAFVLRVASSLELSGWVRNLTDGRVAVEAQGAPASLARLELSLREGPLGARVLDVKVTELEARADDTAFRILATPSC